MSTLIFCIETRKWVGRFEPADHGLGLNEKGMEHEQKPCLVDETAIGGRPPVLLSGRALGFDGKYYIATS